VRKEQRADNHSIVDSVSTIKHGLFSVCSQESKVAASTLHLMPMGAKWLSCSKAKGEEERIGTS
jgi:hypothetical protein